MSPYGVTRINEFNIVNFIQNMHKGHPQLTHKGQWVIKINSFSQTTNIKSCGWNEVSFVNKKFEWFVSAMLW